MTIEELYIIINQKERELNTATYEDKIILKQELMKLIAILKQKQIENEQKRIEEINPFTNKQR